MEDLILSEHELQKITGYRRADKQLAKLHELGFFRARRSRTGSVILERLHYASVCGGASAANEPRVRIPRPRIAA